jgi:hypothetical protein
LGIDASVAFRCPLSVFNFPGTCGLGESIKIDSLEVADMLQALKIRTGFERQSDYNPGREDCLMHRGSGFADESHLRPRQEGRCPEP